MTIVEEDVNQKTKLNHAVIRLHLAEHIILTRSELRPAQHIWMISQNYYTKREICWLDAYRTSDGSFIGNDDAHFVAATLKKDGTFDSIETFEYATWSIGGVSCYGFYVSPSEASARLVRDFLKFMEDSTT